jgi:signal transduction histidine kinase
VAAVSLRARLLVALSYVLLLAILALLVPLVVSVRDRVDAEVKSESLKAAEILAATANGARQSQLPGLTRQAATELNGRVVVVGPQGRVRADSAGPGTVGDDYSNRPEIAGALRRHTVQGERASQTLGQRILATAVPMLSGPNVSGAVRITQSVKAVDTAVNRATLGLALIGGVVLVLGLGAGALIAGQVARPVRRLDEVAARVAAGDLAARAPVEGSAEQRRLARTFNEMTARLGRLLEGQREFVADASHQLRTPLAGMRLRIEEAQATTTDPDAREQLDAALEEVDRLSAMVSELLLLSQSGEPDAPAEPLDLAAAARRAAERWAGAATARRATVEARDGTPSPPAHGARADVDRILDVLVENALAYGPDGQRIVVTAGRGRIEVLDEGPGLAPDEAEAVFERFHRGRAGRAGPPGTGLGLPIARELSRRWGGDVRFEPGDGGARAVVTLPLAQS